jgi:GNAT superfamily N-acetyltransferase
MEDPQIRLATPADLIESTAVLRDVAQWLSDRGEQLWPPQMFTPEYLRPRIQNRELVLVQKRNQVAALALRQWEDPEYWPDRPRGEAAYLHKLAVNRVFSGQGLSRMLLEWAEREAHTAGRKYLRLDCAARPALLSLYQGFGFQRVDTRTVGEYFVVRLEKALS